jgi:pimeloyl-ACP methyl ester carboxylesterase
VPRSRSPSQLAAAAAAGAVSSGATNRTSSRPSTTASTSAAARRDRVFPARDAERLATVLDTAVTWLDDAATFVPLDRPDAVADAVLGLLPVTHLETGR